MAKSGPSLAFRLLEHLYNKGFVHQTYVDCPDEAFIDNMKRDHPEEVVTFLARMKVLE